MSKQRSMRPESLSLRNRFRAPASSQLVRQVHRVGRPHARAGVGFLAFLRYLSWAGRVAQLERR